MQIVENHNGKVEKQSVESERTFKFQFSSQVFALNLLLVHE